MTYPPPEPPPPYDPVGQQPPPYDPGQQPPPYYPGGYPPPPYYPANPYFPYGPPVRETESLAIASLVVSCIGVLGLCLYGLGGLLGLVGAILGHVARVRIRRTGNEGGGLALAGIIVGWILFAVFVVVAIGLVYAITQDNNSDFN